MVEAIGTSDLTSNGSRKTDVRLVDDRLQFSLLQRHPKNNRLSSTVVLSSGDGTTTYCNIDYAPLNDLKSAIIANGRAEESLPPPTTPRLMLPTTENKKEMTIRQILETPAPTEGEAIWMLYEETIIDISRHDSCFRVNMGVQDLSEKTTLTLFTKEVKRLIGVPIEKLMAEIGKDNLTPEIPPVLNNLVGKKCLFEVKITSKNIPGHEYYTVAKLSETQDTNTTPAGTRCPPAQPEATSSTVNLQRRKKQRIA
ncbi:hypothetical protein AG4045_007087 [Apium graveolens]|uniref:Replication factor A C-terminal domain-containing protein n=1 Tax=Apium graveolens TaxID=4045 RepID=A0A6L5BAT6_APIGR|nr:hypothetical protein AG4045_007087 [Apium graveolens]